MGKKLDRKFYNRPTLKVACELLGKYLVVQKDGYNLSGKIVETEAYIGFRDPASHAYRGMTPRNEVMFGDPGYAYIYITYGMYHCLNLVTENCGYPAAVLIRALEPADGIEIMKRRRKTKDCLMGRGLNPRPSLRTGVQPLSEHRNLKSLTSGPAKLCQAFAIDRKLNGADLCSDIIYVEDRGEVVGRIASSSRIGISVIDRSASGGKEGKQKKWRFFIRDNQFVSKK